MCRKKSLTDFYNSTSHIYSCCMSMTHNRKAK